MCTKTSSCNSSCNLATLCHTATANSPSESNGSIGPSLPPVPPTTVSMGTTIVMGPTATKRKKLTVGDVFNQDDDEQAEGKKRKLIPLDYDEDKSSAAEKKPTTLEEKRQRIKGLIESIPTVRDELFNYPLDWSVVDQVKREGRRVWEGGWGGGGIVKDRQIQSCLPLCICMEISPHLRHTLVVSTFGQSSRNFGNHDMNKWEFDVRNIRRWVLMKL